MEESQSESEPKLKKRPVKDSSEKNFESVETPSPLMCLPKEVTAIKKYNYIAKIILNTIFLNMVRTFFVLRYGHKYSILFRKKIN